LVRAKRASFALFAFDDCDVYITLIAPVHMLVYLARRVALCQVNELLAANGTRYIE
jgi:hypothetical protein